jgi:pimeloyl-ACP methyl ester carboxylesterase
MSCCWQTVRSLAEVERFIKSADGVLDLRLVDLGDPNAALCVLCLHGFTRNAADFEVLGQHLASRHRVLIPDQRGRGGSGWDPDPARYHPGTYAADMFAVLDDLGVAEVAIVGTSMGGIVAMAMAGMQPQRLRGVVLNDIGTEMPAAGMQRLHAMLGDRRHPATWDEAITKTRHSQASEFPDYADVDWSAFARRVYRESDGAPAPAYDPAILSGLDEIDPSVAPPDLWGLWPGMQTVPVLVVRGALSEIVTAENVDAMRARHPRLTSVTVPRRGHAPMLDESEALAAVDGFLAVLT